MRRFAPFFAVLPLLLVAAGCDTSKPGEKSAQPLPATVVGTVPKAPAQSTSVPAQYKGGDPVAGKQVFETAGCKGCHTLKDAGATGNVGPNLDQLKPAKAVVAHQVEVGGGAMPAFKGQLSDAQIQAVAAYVSSVAGK